MDSEQEGKNNFIQLINKNFGYSAKHNLATQTYLKIITSLTGLQSKKKNQFG